MGSLLWKYFTAITYFIIFNAAILSLTVTLHELGHFALGWSYGCEAKVVLVDLQGQGTYTILECEGVVSDVALALGAFVFTIPVSFVFLFMEKIPERRFFFVVFGLAISTASFDMAKILETDLIAIFLNIFGTLLILYGEVLLVKERVIFVETVVERI